MPSHSLVDRDLNQFEFEDNRLWNTSWCLDSSLWGFMGLKTQSNGTSAPEQFSSVW